MKTRLAVPSLVTRLIAPIRIAPIEQLQQPTNQKARTLKDILYEFGPIASVSFQPFQAEPAQLARALLLTPFPKNPHPFDYFTLFFTRDLFETIIANTNRYASIQKLKVAQERAREWSNLLIEELYVFLGAIIYMGIYGELAIEIYQNINFLRGLIYTISAHILLCRFEQIKRLCYISCLESDKRAGYYLLENEVWWYKLEPLASSIRASSQQYYSPSSKVSINKLIIQFYSKFVFLSCLTTLLITLNLCIYIKC